MRLNRKGKPYQDPLRFIQKCRVKSRDGLVYHPAKAPAGLCNCGVMLELKPRADDYIFPSKSKANHAISHTLKFVSSIGIEMTIDNFVLEVL